MGLYSYTTALGKRMLVSLRSNPKKWKRQPFSSTRQNDRHAVRQYTALVNGFEIMQTNKRGASHVV